MLTTDLQGTLFLLQLVNEPVSCSSWMQHLDSLAQHNTVHGGFVGFLAAKY